MQSAAEEQRSSMASEFESTDLDMYNTNSTSPKYQKKISTNEINNDICQDSSSNIEDVSITRSSSVTLDEDTKSLWKRCNALLGTEKRVTKFFILSACMHLCVLASVTVSVSYYIIFVII